MHIMFEYCIFSTCAYFRILLQLKLRVRLRKVWPIKKSMAIKLGNRIMYNYIWLLPKPRNLPQNWTNSASAKFWARSIYLKLYSFNSNYLNLYYYIRVVYLRITLASWFSCKKYVKESNFRGNYKCIFFIFRLRDCRYPFFSTSYLVVLHHST